MSTIIFKKYLDLEDLASRWHPQDETKPSLDEP